MSLPAAKACNGLIAVNFGFGAAKSRPALNFLAGLRTRIDEAFHTLGLGACRLNSMIHVKKLNAERCTRPATHCRSRSVRDSLSNWFLSRNSRKCAHSGDRSVQPRNLNIALNLDILLFQSVTPASTAPTTPRHQAVILPSELHPHGGSTRVAPSQVRDGCRNSFRT